MRSRAASILALVALALGCAGLRMQRPPAPPAAPVTVSVVLTDSSLDVGSRLVPRGRVELVIENDGHLDHTLRVVGPGFDEQSDELLEPGGRHHLVLTLGPGTFRLFCPDGDHARRGMSAELVVTDAAGAFRR